MSLWLTLYTAYRGLLSNRFRTLLTMSGIVVGVAALIATLAVGRGSRDAVDARLSSMGRGAIYVNAAWRPIEGKSGRAKSYRLKMGDWHAVAALDGVARVTPLLWDREQVIYRRNDCNPRVLGVSNDFLTIFHWNTVQGRRFTDEEVRSGAGVALLGHVPAQQLFGKENPVDQQVRIGKSLFTVVGVLEPKGSDGMADDNTVLLPISTAQIKIYHLPEIHEIIAEPKHLEQIDAVSEQIVNLLDDRNNCRTEAERRAFEARTSQQMLKSSLETSRTFALLIFLTAALSLLVRRHRHHEHHDDVGV